MPQTDKRQQFTRTLRNINPVYHCSQIPPKHLQLSLPGHLVYLYGLILRTPGQKLKKLKKLKIQKTRTHTSFILAGLRSLMPFSSHTDEIESKPINAPSK